MPNPDDDDQRQHLASQVEQASEIRALLVLFIVLCLRLYRRQIEWRLRGYILPDRRVNSQQYYLVHDRRVLQPTRPRDLIVPIMAAQLLLSAYAFALPPAQAIYQFAIGQLIIAGVAMLPSTRQRKT